MVKLRSPTDGVLSTGPRLTYLGAGTAGMLARDSSFLYVCTATNTWKRVGISTW